MKLIPHWQEQDLSCTFCGTKKSVKYTTKVMIIDSLPSFDSKTEREVCACNKCALLFSKSDEPVSEGATPWIEQIIQEGKRRNEIPLAKILMTKGD